MLNNNYFIDKQKQTYLIQKVEIERVVKMINHHQMAQICICIVILFWLEAYKHHRVILPTLLSANDFLRMTQLYL